MGRNTRVDSGDPLVWQVWQIQIQERRAWSSGWEGELGNIGCMPANLLTLSCQHLLRTENMMLSCLILL